MGVLTVQMVKAYVCMFGLIKAYIWVINGLIKHTGTCMSGCGKCQSLHLCIQRVKAYVWVFKGSKPTSGCSSSQVWRLEFSTHLSKLSRESRELARLSSHQGMPLRPRKRICFSFFMLDGRVRRQLPLAWMSCSPAMLPMSSGSSVKIKNNLFYQWFLLLKYTMSFYLKQNKNTIFLLKNGESEVK